MLLGNCCMYPYLLDFVAVVKGADCFPLDLRL